MSAAPEELPDPAEVLALLWLKGPHSLCVDIGNGFEYVAHFDSPHELYAAAEIEGDVWWGVNPTPGAERRGTRDDVVEAGVLYCDLDWLGDGHKSDKRPSEQRLRDVLAAFPIRPTAVVDTGGGLHPYWRLVEPVGLEEWEHGQELMRAALEAEGLHVEATDAARVLRVPGTVNHKYGTVVRVESFTPRVAGHGVTIELFERRYGHLLAEEETDADSCWSGGGRGPITDFNRTHSLAIGLEGSGWEQHSKRWWSRPDRPGALGCSARIVADDRGEIAFVYSTAPELEVLRSIGKPCRNPEIVMVTAFDVFVEREYDGDVDAALADLRGEESAAPRFGDQWWLQTPELAHVAAAAEARVISREAVLLAVLVNASLYVPQMAYLPGPPRKGSPNLIGIMPGPPGEGKGSAADCAEELLPPPLLTRRLPLGSAEGFVKSFFDPNPDLKERKSRPLVRHTEPVLVRTDEIGAMIQQFDRKSSSGEGLIAQLKQMCSGERLGFGYAAADKRLNVEPHSYRAGLVGGVVLRHADVLFSDRGGGLPERMIFASALVEHLPDAPADVPDDPGPMEWSSPWAEGPMGLLGSMGGPIEVAAEVVEAMARERLDRRRAIRQNLTDADLDTHRVYNRLRVAVALATLHGETAVTRRWHEMAEDVLAVTDATRAWLLDLGRGEQARANVEADERHAARAVRVDDAVARRREARRTEWLRGRAARMVELVVEGEDTVGKVRRRLRTITDTDDFEAVLAYAVEAGWLVEIEEDTEAKGSSARRLRLGDERPS